MVLLLSTTIQQVGFSGQPLLCLLDSGATSSWIARRRLPKGVVINTVPTVSNQTMARMFSSNEQVELKGVVFPEFFCTQKLDNIWARLFHSECCCDVIVGRDMLNALGIAMEFAKKEITWNKTVILMHFFPQIDEDNLPVAQQLLNEFLDEEYNDDNTEAVAAEVLDDKSSLKEEVLIVEGKQEENKGYKSKVIKELKYEATKLEGICRRCMQLSLTQKNELYEVLSCYPTLFDGDL